MAINVPLLEKALEIRRKLASLLGYPTWADYITEVKMVKNAKGVKEACLADPRPRRLLTLLCSSSQTWNKNCVLSA